MQTNTVTLNHCYAAFKPQPLPLLTQNLAYCYNACFIKCLCLTVNSAYRCCLCDSEAWVTSAQANHNSQVVMVYTAQGSVGWHPYPLWHPPHPLHSPAGLLFLSQYSLVSSRLVSSLLSSVLGLPSPTTPHSHLISPYGCLSVHSCSTI